jgi:signal transduction histidine kinase/DNA-binding response OmpR family regulator/ligand-binding sensor domain-containing protein
MRSFHTSHWQQSYPCRVSSLLRACALFILLLAANSQPTAAQDKLLPVFQFNRLTTADGLPSNEIRSNVVRDRSGFIWIGTVNGLARYDGYTCKIYREFTLPNNALKLFIDSKGRLWVGKFATGLSLYDPEKDRFVNFLKAKEDSASLHASFIAGMFEDEAGILWFGTEDDIVSVDPGMNTNADSVVQHIRFRITPFKGFKDGATQVERWDDSSIVVVSFGGLFVVNRHTGRISRAPLPRVDGMRLDTLPVYTVFRESPQKLWLGIATHGLFLLDQDKGTLTAYHNNLKNASAPADDQIQELQLDDHGRMWITTGNGINLFDPRSGIYVDYLTAWGGPGKSMFTRMSIDNTGILWISTADDGLYYLPPASFRFPHYAVRGAAGAAMEMEMITPWSDGTYWITAEGKLLQVRLDDLTVLRTVDLFKGEKSGFGQAVYASLDDGNGTLWFGTWGLGLYSYEPRSGRVKNFRYAHRLPGLAFNSDVCKSLVKATGDTLWVAGYNDKLLTFDTRRQMFTNIPHDPRGQVWHLMKDRSGRIWISDQFLGLFVADPSSHGSELLRSDSTDSGSMSDIHPFITYEDPDGKIWIGGKELYVWDPESRSLKTVVNHDIADALLVLPVGSDSRGRLWVNYSGKGLGILDPNTNTFTTFDYSDGLLDPYNMTSLQDGRVMLVGSRGMILVHPDSLYARGRTPTLVIWRLSVNDSANVPYPGLRAAQLRFDHNQNVLEFEFAAIDPGQGHLIEYRYRLEGLEDIWVNPGGRRFVRYPGLAPGAYVFRVKASSRFGRWRDQETSLAITITPPWWRTSWAYGLYGLFAISLLWGAYRVRLRQLLLQQQAEVEHVRAAHLVEVDKLKSRFFANISHEFRTPLTLILGPIEKIRSKVQEQSVQTDLNMMQRNAHRLLRLINQLLDLSKLEAGAMKLHASPMNIVPLIRGLAYSFESSAGLREIALDVVVEQEEIEVYCDRDMIEKIISNLVSNAFKFTPEGGGVRISVSKRTPSPSTSGGSEPARRPFGGSGEIIEISVADTGIGIPSEQLDKIFDRFYQVDESQTREHEGSGIGLALVKELVEIHHGTIGVKSQVGRGTEFTVRLPLGRSHLKAEEILEAPEAFEPVTQTPLETLAAKHAVEPVDEQERSAAGDQRPIVLIIEDNADVRTYIEGFLGSVYQVLEARDGAAGIDKALENVPDLVISDVMMPKKDGYEVCKTLKLDARTSHIPVILLTAKAASENRIEGLETGADDYLVKPFDPKELLARVKNLIALRRKLRDRFSTGQVLKPGEITVSSIDDTFLQKVKTIVESHLSEEGFGVEDLSRAVGMSRSQIHRKLTALTGLATGDFIRYLRLHRAMDLLQQNAATISEIAYSVGFSTPAHFSKCFHEQFGRTPSEVRRTEH